jgi:hypothetical protein
VVLGAADSELIAIPADYINMVKFESDSDSGYKMVLGYLQIMTRKACSTIGGRWDTEAKKNAGT